ncbi:permease [Demequina pelophila]|uniref:permease n=1 Tax=Demequina pelophila TaxID=1638984 RepID=UPI000B0FC2B4|nr:permease [Demequina pelophila]
MAEQAEVRSAGPAPDRASTRRMPRPSRRVALVLAAYAVGIAVYVLNERFWDWLLWDVVGLEPGSRAGESIHFFLFDTVKILLLLTGVILAVSVLRTFITPERVRALLGGRREGVGNVIAAGLGVAAPFCSCSAVPGFIGFVSAGVPLGVTMSFLIASPLVNEVAVVLLLSTFGLGPALLYAVTGFAIAVIAGLVIGRMRPERWVEPWVLEPRGRGLQMAAGTRPTWDDRLAEGLAETRTLLRKVWPYLVVGIGLGAAIHGWLPEDLVARIAGGDNPFGVLAAVLLGVPLYSGAAGVLPLVDALFAKGVPMGTLLAFMMATVALSVPELVILRRVIRPRLIALFVAIVAAGIVLAGYLFNAVL